MTFDFISTNSEFKKLCTREVLVMDLFYHDPGCIVLGTRDKIMNFVPFVASIIHAMLHFHKLSANTK